MSNLSKNIYHRSPLFLQNILISTYGYYWKNCRFGGVFNEELINFKERENYSYQQWLDYQTTQLRKLLIHAFTTVPFYYETYKKHGFSLSYFETFELHQLKQLPYLEKDTLRKLGTSDLLSTKKKRGKFYASSGSTGTPTQIYYSKELHQKWNAAYEARVRNWAGVDNTMARGMIGGRRILLEAKAVPPFYRHNYAEKQTYLSAYHISPKTVENYLQGIINNKVEYLVGYAMSNYFLADLIDKMGLGSPRLKAVLTSSEKLTPKMRETFKKVYGCQTFDAYSGAEACGLISENQQGDFLFSPDTGIMEVVDEVGNDVAFGDTGEIVATGLLNFDQPLIRYRIGDRVKLSKKQETISGLQMLKIDEIDGRVEDMIIGKDGRIMVRFHGLFIDIPHLIAAQITQHSLDDFSIKLVVEKEFNKLHEQTIKNRLMTQLEEVTVHFIYVNEIPKNNNGKFQAVISNLKNIAQLNSER